MNKETEEETNRIGLGEMLFWCFVVPTLVVLTALAVLLGL